MTTDIRKDLKNAGKKPGWNPTLTAVRIRDITRDMTIETIKLNKIL
jgi:hypothetical protein